MNVPDPVIIDGFVPPELQRHLDHNRIPPESFAEQQIRPDFLGSDEFDLEQARAFRTRCAPSAKAVCLEIVIIVIWRSISVADFAPLKISPR